MSGPPRLQLPAPGAGLPAGMTSAEAAASWAARAGSSADVKVDIYSTGHPQYLDHLQPIWDALGEHQGVWWRGRRPDRSDRLTLVTSYGNLLHVADVRRSVAFMEHGAGFTYVGGGAPFAGSDRRRGVVQFLDLNERTRAFNAAGSPGVPGEVIGCPKLDPVFLAAPKPVGSPPVVAVSFHWDYHRLPEARSAFPHYRRGLADLARRAGRLGFRLIGHAHPRVAVKLRSFYLANGVPFVREFVRVLEQADLYMVDTSSTAYEFAATGRPVLTLNAPWYRRDVDHGLRFWRDIPGLMIDHPEQLADGIAHALADPPAVAERRARAVASVYPVQDGTAAARAAAVLIHRAHVLAL